MKRLLVPVVIVAGLGLAWWFGAFARWGAPAPAAAPATARVYQWKDRQGRLHFGDKPPAETAARTVELQPLTVVTMPKAPPPEPARPAGAAQPAAVDEDGLPIVPPSRQLRNPALERMGLAD